ncbi:MAG: hypothetical protein WCJ49_00065 [Deltaproteobacteria bacterium]
MLQYCRNKIATFIKVEAQWHKIPKVADAFPHFFNQFVDGRINP